MTGKKIKLDRFFSSIEFNNLKEKGATLQER